MKLRTQDQVPMWIQGWLLLSSIVVTWVRKLTKGYT